MSHFTACLNPFFGSGLCIHYFYSIPNLTTILNIVSAVATVFAALLAFLAFISWKKQYAEQQLDALSAELIQKLERLYFELRLFRHQDYFKQADPSPLFIFFSELTNFSKAGETRKKIKELYSKIHKGKRVLPEEYDAIKKALRKEAELKEDWPFDQVLEKLNPTKYSFLTKRYRETQEHCQDIISKKERSYVRILTLNREIHLLFKHLCRIKSKNIYEDYKESSHSIFSELAKAFSNYTEVNRENFTLLLCRDTTIISFINKLNKAINVLKMTPKAPTGKENDEDDFGLPRGDDTLSLNIESVYNDVIKKLESYLISSKLKK